MARRTKVKVMTTSRKRASCGHQLAARVISLIKDRSHQMSQESETWYSQRRRGDGIHEVRQAKHATNTSWEDLVLPQRRGQLDSL